MTATHIEFFGLHKDHVMAILVLGDDENASFRGQIVFDQPKINSRICLWKFSEFLLMMINYIHQVHKNLSPLKRNLCVETFNIILLDLTDGKILP